MAAKLHSKILAIVAAAFAVACPGYANLTFTANFGTSITSLTNAAAIEAVINSTLDIYGQTFSNNINVAITFDNMTSGFGQSSYSYYTDAAYATYRSLLAADATDANDATALANLPNTTDDPVLGKADINIKSANARAVGFGAPGVSTCDPTTNDFTGQDGCVSINFGITTTGNGTSSGTLSAQEGLEHEIDEVLGLGSSLVNVTSSGSTKVTDSSNQIFPEDLFRYSGIGVRSFNVGSACNKLGNAYFSIDGGQTDIDDFNNVCNGGDFGDWVIHNPGQVQDYASGGGNPGLGIGEITALDVIGYNLTVPEPATFGLVSFALIAGVLIRRRASGRQTN